MEAGPEQGQPAGPVSGHGPLPHRILAELRTGGQRAQAAGAKAAGEVGRAAEPLGLEVVATTLDGPRALVGHVMGLRLLLPAEGVHGPRETAALLYLFRDAIALRPTDDAPMSALPLVRLHIVLPQMAVAHWIYKAGRVAHANLDLQRTDRAVETDLSAWTVDDFRAADDKLQVVPLDQLTGPVHLYQRFGFVRLAVAASARAPVRMKSALPESTGPYQRMWAVFATVLGVGRLTADPPAGEQVSAESPDQPT